MAEEGKAAGVSKGRRSGRDGQPMWAAAAVAVSVVLLACSSGGEAAGLAPAPDFEIELFENADQAGGEVVRLSDFKGQPVVVNFWYPSCPPCRLEMPDFESAWQGFQQDGVRLIGVQVAGFDSFEDGQEFVDELGLTYTIGAASDTELIVKYGVRGFPTTVFLNADHEVVRTWGGVLNAEKLSELVAELST